MARRLSPAGAAALAVFAVPRDGLPLEWTLRDRAGRERPWPAAGDVAVRRLWAAARRLDEVVVVGRDEHVEFHTHGGVAIGRVLSERLGAAPPRVAPVESLRAARALVSALHGPLSEVLRGCRPGVEPSAEVRDGLRRAASLLGFGERLRRPARVVLVGRPNAGKSTLFNRWIGHARALVSPRAGTTRDAVVARVLLAGVPVELEDTAGQLARRPIHDAADLLVHVMSEPAESAPANDVPVVAVLGRADEREACALDVVSGRTGEGLTALQQRVETALGLDRPPQDDLWTPILPGHRQQVARAELRPELP